MRLTTEEYERLQNKNREAAGVANGLSSREDGFKSHAVRQSTGQLRKRKGPNKTEAAFGEYLGGSKLGFESITLRMPGGTRYTPDWSVTWPWSGSSRDNQKTFYEVKGFMREAARVRLKEFAAYFTEFRFYLVRAKDRSLRSWQIDEV